MTISVKKGASFKKFIYEHVIVNKQDKLTVFLDLSDDKNCLVYSISFHINPRNDEMKFDISNVIFQDEGNNYHNVCFSDGNIKAIYNYLDDTFDENIYLNDKYGDGIDLYLNVATNRIFTGSSL
jgi:hypothetical protein